MLHVGVVALGVTDVDRAARFWCEALGYGAERVASDRYPDDPDFVVLADTEGNRFCIVDLGHEYR